MRKSNRLHAVFILALACASTGLAGCSKKTVVAPAAPQVTPQPAAEPPALAPTIAISAEPQTIEKGRSTTLSWSAANATSVEIDGGIGIVGTAGKRIVTPSVSTTYNATATGPGGRATASARITVIEPVMVTPPPLPTVSASEFFSTRIADVFFDYDQYNLRSDSVATLDRNGAALAERSEISILIEGHCDERGSEAYNLALGDRRAQAARQHLISKGISAERIEAMSYGEERPFAAGHDEAAWAKNRRAHFVLKGTRLP